MLKGIHHVAIICSNYEVSKYFYHEVLGLKIIAESYRQERDSYKLDLALPDGSQIELFSFNDRPKRPSYPEAHGLRHLAFCVENIDVIAERLLQQNISVEPIRVDELTKKRYTFFSDPDDLPLELYEQ
ncbi:SMU1112c/YaeR family gloxylase I-like metalloprotein [Thalassotalea atypica]|uniref:SMU1112c/YaeR family gloxylase I-like metalloprotein n=1 Tax=Thalassotalea atypica TaxID=2054316 RepID=UPI002572BB8C|nr:VOC family protein [Thalassotalea atypica]